jgi:hypothetical protein
MRRFRVHFVTEIDFVDGDEVSDDVGRNYKKHLAETVQDAAQNLSLRTIKGARVEFRVRFRSPTPGSPRRSRPSPGTSHHPVDPLRIPTIAAHRAAQMAKPCLDATLRPSPPITSRISVSKGIAIRTRYAGR